MVEVESKHSAGSVGYISANNPRYHIFYDALDRLQVPKGTQKMRSSNYNAAFNRNDIAGRIAGDWLLFLDDDHSFEPDFLLRLLDRDVDIVSALYARRYPPFDPVVYRQFDFLEKAFELFTWDTLAQMSGLIEVAAAGAGAILIRKKVFDAMSGPYWFRVGMSNGPEWAYLPLDAMNEDIGFCLAARKAGFKVHLDLDVVVAHLTESLVIPIKHDGRYIVRPLNSNRQWHN